MRFGGVRALSGVDVEIRPGEVLALVGENGAGKSTLMRVLAGIQEPTAGEILWEGRPISLEGPGHASRLGIGMIHQELCLCGNLSVAENLFLGREPLRGRILDRKAMRERARTALDRVGLDVDPDQRLDTLEIGRQQLVEVAKALSLDARVLIFDEPTSSLSEAEAGRLLDLVRALRDTGVAIVWISHRLAEVVAIADRVVALRDGEVSAELEGRAIDRDSMVRAMVGRELEAGTFDVRPEVGLVSLSVVGLRTERWPAAEVSFDLRAGEVVGLAGLVGAGRSELLETMAGLRFPVGGALEGPHAPRGPWSPRSAIRAGMVLVPEDRRVQGLVGGFGVGANLGLPHVGLQSAVSIRDRSLPERLFAEVVDQLGLKASGADQDEQELSGGNQQKVVLGKWLSRAPAILLLDEPTRGVDVGAKAELHALVRQRAADGVSVLVSSGELEELFHLCDRILVLAEGEVRRELRREEFDEQAVMEAAAL